VQPTEFGAGLDPQLIDQDAPRAGEGLQCLGLASGTVQGEHQLTPSPLPKRFVTDHRFQLSDQRSGVPAGKPRVDPVLHG
jgi:hypothetical protein